MTSVIQIEIGITRPIVNQTERYFLTLPPVFFKMPEAGPMQTSSTDTYIAQASKIDLLLSRFR